MKLLLFYGMAGAGKTSLINLITEKIISTYHKKPGFILSDEGEVKLKYDNFPLKELPKGCLPCQTPIHLGKMLVDLYTTQGVDIVIIEPSGMTLPNMFDSAFEYAEKEVGEKFTFSPFLNIVDPINFEFYSENFKILIEEGIRCADYIILNKIDKASAKELKSSKEIIINCKNNANILNSSCKTNDGLNNLENILNKSIFGKRS
jgi:G3E family GTPase|tara:strand:- start:114 stop:725 length:612 start_codon:yes stop_codon:yes gene_type:complete